MQCFAGPAGSTAPCEEAAATNGTATFAQSNLNPGSGLTIVTGFPKGLVTPPTPWQAIFNFISDNWVFAIPIVVLFLMFILWWTKGRDPQMPGPVIAEYESPDGLTPAAAVEILKSKQPSRSITGEIIQLAIAGQITIEKVETKQMLVFSKDDYKFTRLKDGSDLAQKYQKLLLDSLFKGGATTIMLSDLKGDFFVSLKKINRQISKSLIAGGYFDSDPTITRSIYGTLAGFIFLAGFFFGAQWYGFAGLLSFALSALIVLVFGWNMPRRTAKGSETRRKIMGLLLYLNVAEKDRMNFENAPAETPALFEKLLPYAVAFGVEQTWAKKFEGIYTTSPTWYNDHYAAFGAVAFANSLNSFSASSAGIFASSPGSAAGGGSGFGGGVGGGFGGGGGGSW